MKFFIIFIFIILSYYSHSQNLVLNGSFEESLKCADDLQQFHENVKFWNTPSSGSTDLFNDCTEFVDLKPLNNYQGSQEPFDGRNYAGCYFYGIDEYREYIQGSLSESLIKDARYKISLKISLADKSDMAIKDIQVMFTDSLIKSWSTYPINTKRIINKKIKHFRLDFSSDEYFSDKEQWVELSTEFTAAVAANYFTIGNFNSNKQTDKKKQKFIPRIKKAYYYIDDVSIIEIKDSIKESNLSIVPNEVISTTENLELNVIHKLNNVRFEFDSTILIPNSLSELDDLVNFLKENPEINVQIEGHTDRLGSDSYNLKLSSDRAFAIKKYVEKKGIISSRITSKGYGEKRPLNIKNTEEARAQNRRVEFILTK